MPATRSFRMLVFAGATVLAAFGAGGAALAQEEGTTSTTQLELQPEDGSTTTSPPESTTTTQLEVEPEDGSASTTTTQLQVAGDSTTGGGGAVAPPNRVDAGAGGANAGDTEVPTASVLLAAGLVAATGAGAVKVRRAIRT